VVDWAQLINKIQAKRIELAVEAVRVSTIDRPEFQYGLAVGRDHGIDVVLGLIQEMIGKEEDDNDA
jgi:hypothetical protein